MTRPSQQPPDTAAPVTLPRLNGHVAVVTGASRGIGRAIALALGSEGASVACISRTSSEIQSTADEINLHGPGRAIAIVHDLTDIPGIAALLASVEAQLGGGPVSILINNAGIALVDSLEQHRPPSARAAADEWARVITTNLTAPSALACSVLPTMLSRAGGGTIISIGSRNAAFDVPYTCAYSVAKAGLMKLHQSVEAEIGGQGVYNYYLQPGNVDTGILDRDGAVDGTSLRLSGGVQRTLERIRRAPTTPAELVALACVKLITDPDSRLLSGLYVDLDHDIDRVLDDLKRGGDAECVKRNLYRLKIETLP